MLKTTTMFGALACALLLASCADDATSALSDAAQDVAPSGDAGTSGDDADTSLVDAGSDDAQDDDTDARAEDAATDSGPSDVAADVDPGALLPCEVQSVIDAACSNCHADTPRFGAPFALRTLAHFLAPAPSNPAQSIAERALERVQDERDPMPPVPNPMLDSDQVEVLRAWVEAGAPARVGECGDDPDAGADAGSDAEADGGAPILDPELDPSGCEYRMELRAHAGSADEALPNDISPGAEFYECFYFAAPWGEDEAHGLWFNPLIDDERVVHHYLLYGSDDLPRDAGTSRRCSGTHPEAELLQGWAPGAQPLLMPEDVGMQMPRGPNAGFILEIHYNNAGGFDDAADRSGVEVCATSELQEQEAGTHWLGSEAILLLRAGEIDVLGTCTPRNEEPVQILQSWPHMHRYGVHMESEILRADGTRETIVDVPFDFDNQVPYGVDLVVQPGDRIRTRCTFNNTSGGLVSFGGRTEDEMCYNFILAYPAGALASSGQFQDGQNFCLE